MSETLDLDLPIPKAPVLPKVSERAMLDALHKRYSVLDGNGTTRRYAVAEHVGNLGYSANRIADFIALDCYASSGYAFHGHEVKCSRADWLAELRQPDKAEAFKPYMHRWWLVVSHPLIVKDGELPEGWGLMVLNGTSTRVAVKAPRLTPEPVPPPMLASLMRSVAKTAARLADD